MTIAECCFSSLGRDAIGADIDLIDAAIPTTSQLFGETPSRIVISFSPEDRERVEALIGDCPYEVIGTVNSDMLHIVVNGDTAVSAPVVDLQAVWEMSLENRVSHITAAKA